MDELPIDIIYTLANIITHDGHSVLPFLQLRNDWSPARRFYTKGIDTSRVFQKDREHFERFVKELIESNIRVDTIVIRPNKDDGFTESNVFIDLLLEGNMDCVHLLRRVRHIVTDSKLITDWKPYFPLDCILETLHVIIRKRHMHNVELEGWRARKIILQNKRRLRVEFPEDGVIHPLDEEDMFCNVVYGIPKEAKELIVSGSLELSNMPPNVEKVSMDGCILSHKFPATLKEVELQNVRMECSGVLDVCHSLEKLHLENMYGFSRGISQHLWDKWRTTLKYYADVCSLAYVLPHTRFLEEVEEFIFTPGNFCTGRRFHDVCIPRSPRLKKVYAERITISSEDIPFLESCESLMLENCDVPKNAPTHFYTIL